MSVISVVHVLHPPSLRPSKKSLDTYGVYTGAMSVISVVHVRPPPLPPKKKRKQRLREEYAEEYEVDCI